MCSNSQLGAAEKVAPFPIGDKRTLVLGMGNPILGDDGVGVRIAEAVQAALPDGVAIDVSEACVGGLSLMERMVGYERVILIDAMCVQPVRPGTIRRMDLEDLREMIPSQHIASAHDTNLLTALDAGRRMSLPLPDRVTLFAIEAEYVLDFGEELSPEVAGAVPEVVRAVLAELGCPESPLDSENERRD